MEGPKRNLQNNFDKIKNLITVDTHFINKIKEKEWIKSEPQKLDDILKQTDNEIIKRQLFLLLPSERDHYDSLASTLDEVNQGMAAAKLREFVRTEPRWEYDYELDTLKVEPAVTMRSEKSIFYKMDSKPRGRAIIMVTETELEYEVNLWTSIWTQMLFQVVIYNSGNCQDICKTLKKVAGESHEGDAFLFMFIGHGFNEKIRGFGGESSELISINKITEIFSELKCPSLRNKPKIFIFNCCRHKTNTGSTCNILASPEVTPLTSVQKDWLKFNKLTYVIYSCTEGLETKYRVITRKDGKTKIGITEFGLAFSYTIAQYSWYIHLTELVNMANLRLQNEPCVDAKNEPVTEIRQTTSKNIYFNPHKFNS